jgi:hypothetical protein
MEDRKLQTCNLSFIASHVTTVAFECPESAQREQNEPPMRQLKAIALDPPTAETINKNIMFPWITLRFQRSAGFGARGGLVQLFDLLLRFG